MSSAAADCRSCFAYGSLMWADIMARVCGREPRQLQGRTAWLHGHVRHPVSGEDYPGLVPAAADVAPAEPVQGVLYGGLTDLEWQRLDAFEGPEYERVLVMVRVAVRMQPAWVYRFRESLRHRLLDGPWDPEGFERKGKARFVGRYVGFSRADT